jgi:hypothetical protein
VKYLNVGKINLKQIAADKAAVDVERSILLG